jgi:membrane protease YdiL (CAAX protease family)
VLLPDVATLAASPPGIQSRHAGCGEIALVLGLPTALFLAASIAWLVRRHSAVAFTDLRVGGTLFIEVVTAIALLPFLARRGSYPRMAAGAPEPRDVVRGVGVWLGSVAAYYVTFATVGLLAPAFAESLRAPRFSGALSAPVMVAATVLNPIFEEFLWLGYAVPALSSRVGRWAACGVSIALRVAVHAYQGPLALVAILPVALVLTGYFARTGRLWPVVVAHVIADAAGLLAFITTR